MNSSYFECTYDSRKAIVYVVCTTIRKIGRKNSFPYLKHLIFLSLGHVGWGIGWYINGLLIPEIYVVRGKTYTFVIEGGNDPDSPAGMIIIICSCPAWSGLAQTCPNL